MTDMLSSIKRDAKIIEALHVAMYTLVVHSGATCTCEGESFPMDFSKEIKKIGDVMTMLGVDITDVLPAPIDWTGGNSDEG